MESKFVTYKIAKALKELGFNEECLGFFPNEYPKENHLIYRDLSTWIGVCRNEHTIKNSFTAPLWQDAIDWFGGFNINIFFFKGENSGYRNVWSFSIHNAIYELVPFDFENGDSDIKIIRELAILKAIELVNSDK